VLFVLLRFGILAFISSVFFFSLLLAFPITAEFSASYFRLGLTGLVFLLTFALYAFHTSLGGRPLFDTPGLTTNRIGAIPRQTFFAFHSKFQHEWNLCCRLHLFP